MIFQQNEARPPAREIEPVQHFELVAFDVDRQEIELGRRARLAQDVVGVRTGTSMTCSATAPGAIRSGSSDDSAPATWRGICRPALAGDEQAAANTLAERAAQVVGKVGLRLYQNAGPAELLEVPGLRCLAGTIGADLDEDPGEHP